MLSRIINAVKRRLNIGRGADPEMDNFGIQGGPGSSVGLPRRPVDGAKYITMGTGSIIGAQGWICAYDAYPLSGQTFTPQITFGNNVLIGAFSTITAINRIVFEDGVETSDFLYVSDHTHSSIPEEGVSPRNRRLVSRGHVHIGAYTGIGINVSILPGVTLGKYCIVGAQSVVTRSFPDYSMIGGNPAVMLKTYSVELKKWVYPTPKVTGKDLVESAQSGHA